jgi:eukaryotic-like serine/threonine-protein kinase
MQTIDRGTRSAGGTNAAPFRERFEMTADRDLLFGLLALQIGLIDQEHLIAAFRAWAGNKSRPMADYLTERGDLDEDDRAAVDALVARHLKKHGGSTEKSLAAIPAGVSTRESLARIGDPQIEQTLVQLGSGTPKSQAESGENADRTASYSVGTATSEGQRFRVLRPHARGGLGAVFVALDEELHREVALKRILDQHADDPVSRQRFVLEAEVTGSLEHPGIVPVYGLGNYADGRPFYAMRFIRGDSLKEAIDEFHSDAKLKKDPGRRSLELRKLLGRFNDVCNAIEYAHGRGVLHRDIKPGNIIVGKHGETLVVDWGLAKALGRVEPGLGTGERTLIPSSASGSASTLPGAALGTPSYMSPEQSQGDLENLGPRSDVYSLGATLFCLLTGKPPLEGDLVDVIRRVQKGQIPPPRQLDPSIDRALEAICMKAMALKPADRFGSPKALADDVERWMADEPVTSWREPWTRGLVRWLTRHRVGVTAAGAALLVALAGTAAVLAVQTQANGALRSANMNLAVANAKVTRANTELAASNQRERARFALAQEAICTFHTGVSEDILLKEEQFKALRTKLLRGARDFYRKLEGLLQGHEDRDSRLALGQSYLEVGELTRELDSIVEAGEVFRRAESLFEGLSQENPADREPRRALAQCLNSLAIVLSAVGRHDDAPALARRSRDLRRTLAEADPTDPGLRVEWARAEIMYGMTLSSSQRPPGEALAVIERARSILEVVASAGSPSADLKRALADVFGALALTLEEAGRRSEARVAYERARDLCEALFQANPSDPTTGHELARTLGNLAICLADTGHPAEALAAYNRARDVLKVVSDANPTIVRLPAASAWIDGTAADVLVGMGRDDEALEALERARVARELLIKENPAVTRNHEQLIRVHRTMADIHRRAGRGPKVLASLERVRETAANLLAAHPQKRGYQDDLVTACCDLADANCQAGKVTEGRSWFDQALEMRRRMAEAEPSASSNRSNLATTLRRSGIAMQQCGQMERAVSDFRQAIVALHEMTNPAAAEYYNLACYQSLLSGALLNWGSGLSAADGRAAADLAMSALWQAIAAGWKEASWAKADTDLDPIRSRADFQALMLDLGFPANPLVGATK